MVVSEEDKVEGVVSLSDILAFMVLRPLGESVFKLTRQSLKSIKFAGDDPRYNSTLEYSGAQIIPTDSGANVVLNSTVKILLENNQINDVDVLENDVGELKVNDL